ncbi:hypothetical protein GE09DRAFT_1227773 [Coniochaeta sp. 2T2.1]|nr:hypothetical protein GE09DRAFT_1227773 [Coniochaeta sp. 2T2.1]
MARRRPAPPPSTPSTSTPSDPSRVVPTSVSASVSSATFTVAASGSSSDVRIKQRIPHSTRSGHVSQHQLPDEKKEMRDEEIPMADHLDGVPHDAVPALPRAGTRNKWIVLAIASGACAAFNGVFAKLATGELTSSISRSVSHFLHLSAAEGIIEVIVRVIFFGLNLAFNGVMWTLFTQALAKGHSTTQVSIMNTSSNFVLTAVLGFAIFSESLPPLWWLGAAMLVAGNVIIGGKDESASSDGVDGSSNDRGTVVGAEFRDDVADGQRGTSDEEAEEGLGAYRDADAATVDQLLARQLEKEDEEDVPHLGELGDSERR